MVGAWRQKFGLVRLVPYSKFRDLCASLEDANVDLRDGRNRPKC